MLGKRLKTIRIALKLTQSKMAEYMGVTLRAYQRYENGEQDPTAGKLNNLLKKLNNVSAEWLLTGEGCTFKDEDYQKPKENIKSWIDNFWENATEKERHWFEIQFGKYFPEFLEWVKAKKEGKSEKN